MAGSIAFVGSEASFNVISVSPRTIKPKSTAGIPCPGLTKAAPLKNSQGPRKGTTRDLRPLAMADGWD